MKSITLDIYLSFSKQQKKVLFQLFRSSFIILMHFIFGYIVKSQFNPFRFNNEHSFDINSNINPYWYDIYYLRKFYHLPQFCVLAKY